MQDSIKGVLESNEVTERYHGLPFARQLSIRTMYGKTIIIEDPVSIANDLQTGKSYEFIMVVAGVERVRAFTHSKTMSAKFSGTIRHLKWEPDHDRLLICNDDLINQPMSVVGTVSGHVIISRLLLGGVSVGNAITWGKDNFELVGVYKS
ncbi:MAG: hypothetical protein AAF125_11175 [Chloroflexota bacterium]